MASRISVSGSISSRTRKLGMLAARWTESRLAMGPLLLCGAMGR